MWGGDVCNAECLSSFISTSRTARWRNNSENFIIILVMMIPITIYPIYIMSSHPQSATQIHNHSNLILHSILQKEVMNYSCYSFPFHKQFHFQSRWSVNNLLWQIYRQDLTKGRETPKHILTNHIPPFSRFTRFSISHVFQKNFNFYDYHTITLSVLCTRMTKVFLLLECSQGIESSMHLQKTRIRAT